MRGSKHAQPIRPIRGVNHSQSIPCMTHEERERERAGVDAMNAGRSSFRAITHPRFMIQPSSNSSHRHRHALVNSVHDFGKKTNIEYQNDTFWSSTANCQRGWWIKWWKANATPEYEHRGGVNGCDAVARSSISIYSKLGWYRCGRLNCVPIGKNNWVSIQWINDWLQGCTNSMVDFKD